MFQYLHESSTTSLVICDNSNRVPVLTIINDYSMAMAKYITIEFIESLFCPQLTMFRLAFGIWHLFRF